MTNLLGPYLLFKPGSLPFLSSLWTLKYHFNPLFSASVSSLITVAYNQEPWLKHWKAMIRKSLKKKITSEDIPQYLPENLSTDKCISIKKIKTLNYFKYILLNDISI